MKNKKVLEKMGEIVREIQQSNGTKKKTLWQKIKRLSKKLCKKL